MTSVGAITGQSRLIADINQILWSTDRPAIRLRGPSGSGKTWVARTLAESWRDAGGVAFVATGDEMFIRRPHFPLLLAVSSETGRARSKAVTTLALEPVSAIPFGGKPLREVLLHLFEWRDSDVAARTPYLRQDDREIFMRMQKAAARRRTLLVCDNMQWWDEASLELLGLALAPGTRAAFAFLENMAVLALHTTGGEAIESPSLQSLFTATSWRTFELPLCGAASFGELLRAFGVSGALPLSLIERLFAVTGGHLELIRRIAEAGAKASSAQLWDSTESRPQFLFDLLEQRLERHTSVPEETASVLRAASVIGNSFADHELDCLLRSESDHLRRILEPAERLRILERSGNVRTFAHDVVRTYYLQHAKTRREELHQRFSECLRLVHAGDYARRAEHLRRSSNHRAAGEVSVLECLRAMRAGHPSMLEALRDRLDDDLVSFVAAMYPAHSDLDAGHYHRAIEHLVGIEDLYTDALLAERDILLARCHIKLLSRAACEQARAMLSRWGRLKESETEVWGRAMIYLVVACVFLGDEMEARAVERALYETLAARVSFDPTARRTVNHIRLKSNMLHSVPVARGRLRRAVEFFSGVGEMAVYDPVHQCIGLINLAANHLVEGEFEQALALCHQASALIELERSMTFGRPDILATNLTLAGYLCGRLSAPEALAAARSIWRSRDNNDRPLLASNVAYYLARQMRHAEAIEFLGPVFSNLTNEADPDSYNTYYVGNNLCGSLYMEGRSAESQDVWTAITPFVRDFIGPPEPYMRRRHEIQSQIFSADRGPRDWDGFLAVAAPPQVGPGWKFYGRGFLASELEFWSDE